jgi:pilus assembly protein CpaE
MTRALLLATSPSLVRHAESLRGHHVAAIDQDTIIEVMQAGGVTSLLGALGNDVPDVVLIGEDIAVNEALSLAESIDASCPGVDIVLVAEPETDLVVRAMRVGVRDIVSPTIGSDELKVIMQRSTHGERSQVRSITPAVTPGDRSRVVVVASPKGGVGKSVVATNVAVALAKDWPMQTVLVDLDLQFGDAGMMLDLTPVHTVADAFESTAALDTLILKTFLTVHASGFYVLCGAESPTVKDKVSAEQVTHLIQQLSAQFRYVVVDTSAGLHETTLSAIDSATDLVLVSTMDVTSTSALRKEIQVLDDLDLIPASRHFVLNFADRKSGVGVRSVEAAIGLPVDVIVPRSSDVPLAGNLGQAVVNRHRSGPVAKAIAHLIARIHQDEEAEIRHKHRGMEVA